MISDEERIKLEIQFTKHIDFVINELMENDFSEHDIGVFTDTVKTFLKFFDLKKYLLTALNDKVLSVSTLIHPNDKESKSAFRKLLSVIIKINDDGLIDSLETFFAKDQDPECFFTLLEEEVRQGANISRSIDLFISLIRIHRYDIWIINKFLNIIGQEHKFLITSLLEKKLYETIRHYLQQIGEKEKSLFEEVVPVIIARFNGPLDDYFNFLLEIIVETNDHTHNLLNYGYLPCQDSFTNFVLSYHHRSLKLIKNIYSYIQEYKLDQLDRFETDFLNCADSDIILAYALEVASSNKRRILKRLSERRDQAKDEKILVEFIKHFPEYRALLPML